MPGHIGKTTNRHRDVIGSQTLAERETIWGEMQGEVVDFDPEAQTATIQPLYQMRLNGEPTDLPQLLKVPVRFPRIGGFVVTVPAKEGDLVTLRPMMRNSENYHDSGGKYETADGRTHSLSDYEAFLDGGEPLSKPIENFNAENLEIRSEDGSHKLEMSEDGKFRLQGAEGELYSLMKDALAKISSAFETLAGDQLQINSGSSAGSGHAMEEAAAYQGFADEIQEISDKIEGMTIT